MYIRFLLSIIITIFLNSYTYASDIEFAGIKWHDDLITATKKVLRLIDSHYAATMYSNYTAYQNSIHEALIAMQRDDSYVRKGPITLDGRASKLGCYRYKMLMQPFNKYKFNCNKAHHLADREFNYKKYGISEVNILIMPSCGTIFHNVLLYWSKILKKLLYIKVECCWHNDDETIIPALERKYSEYKVSKQTWENIVFGLFIEWRQLSAGKAANLFYVNTNAIQTHFGAELKLIDKFDKIGKKKLEDIL